MVLAGLMLIYLLLSWFAFDPLMRWALPRWAAQQGGHQLSLERARFDPWRLAADLHGLDLKRPDGAPLLHLGQLHIDFDAASPFRRAWVLEQLQITEPVVHLELQADGRLNWLDLVDSLAGPDTVADTSADITEAEPTRWLLRQLSIVRGRLALADHAEGRDVSAQVDPLDLDVQDLSTLPEDRGEHRLSATFGGGAKLRWRGRLALHPVAADGELALDGLALSRLAPYLASVATMAPPQGQASVAVNYRLRYDGGAVALQLEQIQARLQGLALQGADAAAPAVTLEQIALRGGRFDLAERSLSVEAVEIGPGRIAVQRDAEGRLDLQAWAPPPSEAASSADGKPWRVDIERVSADGLALQFKDQSLARALSAEAGALQFGFGASGEFGGAAPTLVLDKLEARLNGLKLSSDGLPDGWFVLDSLALADGRLSVHEQTMALGAITLDGGRLRAARDAQGRIALLEALQPRSVATTASPASAGPPWRLGIERFQAKDFELALSEGSVTPATELRLTDLQAELQGLSEKLDKPLPVTLSFGVSSGGRVEARGQLVPSLPSADLRLTVSDLSLLPAQAYVAQATTLTLAQGAATTRGRLRWQPDGWRYDGGVTLGPLQIDEADTGERFLSWQRLRVPALHVSPQGLRVREVNAEGLGAKLIIFKDKTLNLTKIMKATPDLTPAPADPSSRPFDIDIRRVTVADGTLDFADLSLALPFGTRIHGLAAQIIGLKQGGDEPAQLELEGKVDEFGLARAAGQLRLFDPTAYTDVKVEFRNVEMNTLTPYSATFAGRRIASGKLSLDLEYKIKDRQLAGENQVIMDRLTLGERVESPTAANLPLDLAIALLEDADGRIDLGLPVSGSLDDPQFSYGQIVWKAIVNVLTKIVTAPFRALGALLGGGEQTMDRIVFDLGRSELLPPEREKLKKLAQALAKRPGLSVTVQGGFDPEADALALRQRALRRAVAEASGRTLAADEDPGPISTGQPETRQALEKLFEKRLGAEALARLRQRLQQANPAPPPPTAGGRLVSRLSGIFKTPPAPLPADEAARLKGADLHELLLDRLLASETVDNAQLQALGSARAQAIGSELASREVAAARVAFEPVKSRAAETAGVTATLGLKVAGAAPAPAPVSGASAPAAASAPR